ncbi:hypothetical protein GALL_371680 [mine drainage metagenome]|uniref:Uncharacterized protein n=1 Tax=mine drainage metagenome TaxID=410659 RepID=A0A1J5QYT4_9ZZZZ
MLPELGTADADQGRDGRREGDGVVGVEDAGHEAEGQEGDDEPAPPHEQGRTRTVGAREPATQPETGTEEHECRRDQPRDLPTELTVEEPGQPCAPPLPAGRGATADGPGLAAGQTTEPVVAERQLEERVGLRASDVRTHRGRHELDESDPPSGREDQGPDREKPVADAAPEGDRCGDEVGQRESGEHEERLQLLGEETEPDKRTGEHHPAGPPVLHGPHRRPGSQHEEQHEERVGVVEAEHQGRDRGQREDPPGEQGRTGRRVASDARVHDADGRDAHQRLRDEDRPGREPEDPHAQCHDPQAGRRLVDGDRPGGVGRAVQERRPARRPGLHGGRVEAVRPAGLREVPQVQDRGQRQEADECRSFPPRAGRAAGRRDGGRRSDGRGTRQPGEVVPCGAG